MFLFLDLFLWEKTAHIVIFDGWVIDAFTLDSYFFVCFLRIAVQNAGLRSALAVCSLLQSFQFSQPL